MVEGEQPFVPYTQPEPDEPGKMLWVGLYGKSSASIRAGDGVGLAPPIIAVGGPSSGEFALIFNSGGRLTLLQINPHTGTKPFFL